ncbi:MAG: family F420-dependent class oxidoreductase [Actinomycetia bacterium]|nr:family F420-dependent class oxidoreductase [Actinomycetes bacterium]
MDQAFGIKLPGLVPGYARTFRDLPDLVVELEALGYDDVWDGEHILFGPVMPHPGGAGNMVHGRTEKRSDRADTMIMFAAIAARTSTIKMYSSVILAAAHNFAILARQAATLDVISNGRFVLGVGMGWFAKEFVAMGIPPKERDERLEEVIRACQELWSPGLSSFEGMYIKFQDVLSEPAPVTPGGVPVWWGGNAIEGPTARRIATLGHGWLSREAADYDEVARSIEGIRKACADVGRDPDEIGYRASISPTPPEEGPIERRPLDDVVEEYVAYGSRLADLGITHFNIPANYLQFEVEELGQLLVALRRA